MPDIDTDFDDEGQKVIDYVIENTVKIRLQVTMVPGSQELH